MDFFYLITIAIAIVILTIVLVGVWYVIKTTNAKGTIFPNVVNQCPDLWLVDNTTGNCIIPDVSFNATTTSPNLGILTQSTYSLIPGYAVSSLGYNEINFSDAGWASQSVSSATCAKKTWASVNGVVWDTVTNYNQC